MVEFALVVVLLMMLVMGIISFGITFNRNITIESAARESARFAATFPVADSSTGDLDGWLIDVAQAAEDAAAGVLDPGADGRSICVAQGADSTFEKIEVTGFTLAASGTRSSGECFANIAPTDQTVVQVQLEGDGWIQVVVYQMTPTLTGEATNRYERTS
jgi:hypothetical protein